MIPLSQLDEPVWEEDIDDTDDVLPVLHACNAELPVAQRLLATHRLLERFLRSEANLGGAQLQSLVPALLDMAIEADRLPQIAVKVLWCIAGTPRGVAALERHDAIPTMFGILRGNSDVLLAAAVAQFLERMCRSGDALAAHLRKASSAQLLLRSLWRWRHCLEIVTSLLQVFTLATRIPCYRSIVAAELTLADNTCLGLPQILWGLAQDEQDAVSEEETIAWARTRTTAASLAREWDGIARALG
ncbi:unnamed protein product [Effrenium voratum]|nr:unnamed protein product [Effrenium voratum]